MNHHDLWGTAPGNNTQPHLCSIDPITLAVGALGSLAGGLMGGGGGGGSTTTNVTQAPEAAPPQAPPQRSPTGQKKSAGGTPSFIGSAIAPPTASRGGKTLLGQ